MSVKSIRVVLRRERKLLGEVTLKPGCESVLVGRARECALRLPADDHSASGVHARIFWKGSKLMLEDADSRNGVFLDGALIRKPCKLVPGALFALGSCLVSAEYVNDTKSKELKRHNRLEILNGDRAGRIVDIVPKRDGKDFDIGLDPVSSIHLNDLLVSRRHVTLKTRENGECWIEDLGSRNGTYINGERLAGKERLLKDGDKISIAYFDFRFLDRNVAHTRVQAWLKLGVVSVTVCLVAAGYIAWTTTRGSVENYLRLSRELAARGEFTKAVETAESARNARDAGEYRTHIDSLVAQIGVWSKTRENWQRAQKCILDKKLKQAWTLLNGLSAGSLDTWGWDPQSAAVEKKNVDSATRALRLYYDAKDAVTAAGRDTTPDADLKVRATIGPVEEFLAHYGNSSEEIPVYMQSILTIMRELLDELQIIRSGYDAVDASIAQILADKSDFRDIYESFSQIAADELMPPAVRGYARQQLAPCRDFIKAQEFLSEELERLVSLDFNAIKAADANDEFKLPSMELCTRHAKYSDVRAAFESRHRKYIQESVTLEALISGLTKVGVTLDSCGEIIDTFDNRKLLKKALSFDCLKRPPPNMRRLDPVGTYDTLFGIEHTYESLRALPGVLNGQNIRSIGFKPKCVAALQIFDRAEAFVQYLGAPERSYLHRGNIGGYYKQCVLITIKREELVKWLDEFKGTARQEIVAGYYSDYFSSSPTDVAKRLLSVRFLTLKKEMIALGESYQLEMNPEKQVAIRDEIIAKGIPGDSTLHSKWAQKYD